MISYCQFCNKEINFRKKRTYCTKECEKQEGIRKRTFVCTQCKETFVFKKGEKKIKKTKKTDNIFCSRSCWNKHQTGSNNVSWTGVKRFRNCTVCNDQFLIKCSNQLNRKYCSINCYKKDPKRLIELICEICNQKFLSKRKKKTYYVTKFCSRKCADLKHSLRMKGNGNSNYFHGESELPYSGVWRIQDKENIRIRDNYECQLCSIKQTDSYQKLHVHHIDFNKANHSEENLIALCKPCHMRIHGKHTRNIWKEKLLNLLKEKKKYRNMFIM